jgi:hypothetical protein
MLLDKAKEMPLAKKFKGILSIHLQAYADSLFF